jgi:hypothetical protein
MAQKQAESKSPNGRQVTEEKLVKDLHARKAFEELTVRRRVNKEKLLLLLSSIPFASKKPLGLVDGMEDRRVRRLPDRIRMWADVIGRLNASPWLTPNFLPKHASNKRNPGIYPKPLDSILTTELAEPTANLFHGLPSTLRFYADHLQARMEFFHPTGRRQVILGYPRKRIDLRKLLTLELLWLVRDSTQGPRYNEVATLLNRAYVVAGNAQTLDEDDLSKLVKNNEWTTWVLHEASQRRKPGQGVP